VACAGDGKSKPRRVGGYLGGGEVPPYPPCRPGGKSREDGLTRLMLAALLNAMGDKATTGRCARVTTALPGPTFYGGGHSPVSATVSAPKFIQRLFTISNNRAAGTGYDPKYTMSAGSSLARRIRLAGLPRPVPLVEPRSSMYTPWLSTTRRA